MKRSNGGDALGSVAGKLARMAVCVALGMMAASPAMAGCDPDEEVRKAMERLRLAQDKLTQSERALTQASKTLADANESNIAALAPVQVGAAQAQATFAQAAGEVSSATAEVAAAKAKASFADLRFGVGIGVAFGDRAQVSDASVEGADELVRVKKSERDQVRLVFEAHKYLFVGGAGCRVGHGPFVSVQSGGDGASLNSFGLGWMMGVRDKVDGIENAGWSLGIGYYLDNSVRKLGDGIHENQPLPAGDQLRFKEESDGGFMLVFSRTF